MTSIRLEEALPKARELLERAFCGEQVVLVSRDGSRVKVSRENSSHEELPDRSPGALAGRLVVGPEFFEPLPDDEMLES